MAVLAREHCTPVDRVSYQVVLFCHSGIVFGFAVFQRVTLHDKNLFCHSRLLRGVNGLIIFVVK